MGPAAGGSVWQPRGYRTALGDGGRGPADIYPCNPCTSPLPPHLQTQSWLLIASQMPYSLLIPIPHFFFSSSTPWKSNLKSCKMKGAGSPAWLLMLHTAGERGHGVRLQSCKNTLPKEGQRSIRKGLWHPPPGQIHGKGVCSEPDEQTSHDDNQIIFENEIDRKSVV